MNTYGFHTIHGRGPAFVMGIKTANPDLSVWLATGDGDGLSIGGNQLMHCLRRNIDVNILLFNNRIYGLTKGQYSPTSEVGKVTKSTPLGSADPAVFALGASASFVARAVDTDAKLLTDVLRKADGHRGTSFVEIFQNCNVFNDHAFDAFVDKKVKADREIWVEHGKPLVFGKERDKGLRVDPKTLALEVVSIGKDGVTEDDLVVHDETSATLAYMLARMPFPQFPVAVGVLHRSERRTYEDTLVQQAEQAMKTHGKGDIDELLHSGETWTV
jgi:2-oxoglutarate ferredoxin oxidoreductase subunit beta